MKYLSHIFKTSLLNRLAFYVLLGSCAFVVLLWSPNVLGKRIDYWNKIIIFLLPWGMLWLVYSWQVLTDKNHRCEIILIVSIITLGVINAFLSDAVAKSTPQMRDFLVTGVFASLRSSTSTGVTDWYRLLVLFGLLSISMSYDSLLFPPINWLFHVQLGIMAGYYASNQASGSISCQPQIAT